MYVLIKPASGLCNMRCSYCFYRDVSANREHENMGMMSYETLEILVKEVFSVAKEQVNFAFQGGEPTLAGIDFYEKFVELVEKYRRSGIKINFSIQTNGLAINEVWADFLAKHNFLTGLSLDGNADLHNIHRIDSVGKGTFNRVISAMSALKKANAMFNILCVVTCHASRRAQTIYDSLKKMGCRYLQFIPCLNPLNGTSSDMGLTPGKYAVFLKTLFDLWYEDWRTKNYTSIRLFEDYVHILTGRSPSTCATSGVCGQYVVVEGDGSVYPCDFYVLDEWRLGTIREQPLTVLMSCERARLFIEESRAELPECADCKYRSLCRGGCKRDRIDSDGVDRNYYCSAFKDFWDYSIERLINIASIERRISGEVR